MAERTGLEPATPCVTGRYSNQLNYRSTGSFTRISNWLMPACSCYFPCHGKRNTFFTNLMPGSSLLSHGETPHYHRRYGVSLLSSAWGQVGPPRYCRQANSVSSIPHHVMISQHTPPYEPISEQSAENLLQVSKNTFGVVRLSLSGH